MVLWCALCFHSQKLYIGRERGMELSGAIASNQRMMQYMPAGMFMGAAGSLKPGAPMQAAPRPHAAPRATPTRGARCCGLPQR